MKPFPLTGNPYLPRWLVTAPRPIAIIVWIFYLPIVAAMLALAKARQRALRNKANAMLARWKREQDRSR